jgi:hypothetical protein
MQKENIVKYAILSGIDGQKSRKIRVYCEKRYKRRLEGR